ncbi:hypothetical protein SAMN04487765_2204 [Tenacibaculum sp. MAR_2010_89]|uniref:hypothetical protein n=1 Tax=Tenacibaculum sp. MAR_2010_89 TaxID=1250198 RepID=UPI00089B68FA|nr:hypothetical protein [Tenacibaculum sp. MAR_2010_89]SEE34242.1 hypothetical protein SAMN04487765_2204 [Tenacibaculum sp. MAR_2010_89]
MKYINILKKLNRVLIVTTIVMYLTIYLGLLVQVILGAYQLLIAFVLLFFIKNFSKKSKNKLMIYWLVVLLYGMVWIIDMDVNLGGYLGVILYIILPMIIALYFSYFLESLRIKNK